MTDALSSTEDKIEETAQHNDVDNYNDSLEAQQQFAQGDKVQQRCCNFKSFCLIGISTITLALFLYASIVQYNDPDSAKWAIYYGLQAAIPLLFVLHFFTWISTTAVVLCAVSLGMIIWSIVMIVLISIELKNLLGGEEYQREEFVNELSGVSLGIFSALYHVIVTRFCVRGQEERQEARVDR